MKITIEKIEEGFKYSFGVPFTYTLEEMPDADLIKSLYAILGYRLDKEFSYEFPFSFVSEEELPTNGVLEYIEKYKELLEDKGFREQSIKFVQSVIFNDIKEKSKGLI